MTSIIKVDTIQDIDGNNIINENANTITIGASGDTITIPAGATIDASGATVTLPTTIEVDAVEPQSGTTLTLGASGDTVSVPTGATLDVTNATVTGLPASGKVLQVIAATYATETTSASATLADTGLTASITPSSASNKILVIVHQNGISKTNSDAQNDLKLVLKRGATTISELSIFSLYTNSTLTLVGQTLSTAYLDSPSTTSSTTYKTQFANVDSVVGLVRVQDADSMSTITLMEISA
jgi:hypothetical protein